MPKKPRSSSHQTRDPKRLIPLGVSSLWDSVPPDVILTLIRSYASMGDAILFGTSADRAVASIRIYRGGVPYSVYFRNLDGLDEALDRLDRHCPAFTRPVTVSQWSAPDSQVKSHTNKSKAIDWEAFTPVKRQETQISADRIRTLAKSRANRRASAVADLEKS